MTIDNNRTENKQNIAAELLRTKSADVTQAHDRLLYAMLSFVGESDCEMLLDKIVDYAMNIASADGAILYTCEDNVLNFARIRSEAHGFPFAQQSDAKSIPGLRFDYKVYPGEGITETLAVSPDFITLIPLTIEQ